MTCEVTPHHLLLTDRAVVEAGFDAHFKMNPPLRSERDREALLAGAGRRHGRRHRQRPRAAHLGRESASSSSSRRSASSDSRPRSPSASSGWSRAGSSALARLIELLDRGPARVLGLPGGTLAPGAPADVTVIDLERELDDRGAELPQQVAQHAVRRLAGNRRRRA